MAEHYIIDGKEHVYESAAEKHLTDKTITENGTYSAEDESGNINGYKNVTVDVEGGGGGTVTKTVYTTVTGGYNGGAVIAITIDEEVVFTATAIDTYNRNYNITHDVIYISGSPVIIDITPPETNTSALGISIEGINTIQYSVMPDGANTSYGYNFSDSDPLTVGGGGGTLVEKTITENGTYDPADDNADGYSQVSVDVPYRPLIGTTIPSNSQGSNGDTYIYGSEVVPTGLGWAADEAYLVEDANELLATASGRPYYKINDGMAIGVFLKALDYAGPVLISSNPEYVYYTYNSSGTNYNKIIDGITMYMSTFHDWYGSYSVPSDGALKDCMLEVNYNAARSADYEGIFDAILEATAFTVGNGGIVCRDIYYKESGVWKTSGFAIDTN